MRKRVVRSLNSRHTPATQLAAIPHPQNYDLVDEMAETDFERQRRLAREDVTAPCSGGGSAVDSSARSTQIIGEGSVPDFRNK